MTAEEVISVILHNRPRRDAALARLGAFAVRCGWSRREVMDSLGISKSALSRACITLDIQVAGQLKMEEIANKYGLKTTDKRR